MKSIIEKSLEVLLSIIMGILVILALWQVFTRYILQDPSIFTEELLRYAMIWMAMLGAVYAFSTNQHMALVFLKERVSEAKERLLMVLTDVLIIFFASVMVSGGFFLVSRTYHQITPVLGWSMGLVYLIVPLSGLLIILVRLIDMKNYLKNEGD